MSTGHGSHDSHSSSNPHSNSITKSTPSKKGHSVSFGSTSVTGIPAAMLGSLAALNKAAAEVKNSLDNKTGGTPPGEGPLTRASLEQSFNSSKGSSSARYQNGTLTASGHAQHGVSGGHSNSLTLNSSNNQYNNPTGTQHAQSGDCNQHLNSSTYQGAAYGGESKPSEGLPSVAWGGTRAKKSDAVAALNVLNRSKMLSNTVSSFGTASLSGNSHYNHSSHAVHSSS